MVKTEIIKTITSIFMVPTLKISSSALKNNNFINGYVKDEMREDDYKDAIYLLFRPDDIDRFREFLEDEYERTKDIIEDYDHHGFVVVVYKLNIKFANDFHLIRMGKYSKTSPEYRIFNRTEDLMKFWEDKFEVSFEDQELWQGWQIQDEILTEQKLKEYGEQS